MRFAILLNKVVTALTIISLIVPPALAQDIVGAGANGPQVLNTANGTPLVMIQKPNAAGVSHNTYSQFDVGTSGVVLNNVGANYGLTNLGGYVQGNANLSGGSASLIINEVTSADASELLGYVEVGGAAANVVIANPWGITCNGCGFINTPRAVLTTGTPGFSGDALQGFSVDGGTIAIGELGLDARGVSQFDLIARKVTFGGSVHGQRVRVIAGRNDVLFATSEATAKASDGNAEEFAIDSSVLGGMYAGSISIISTEQGAGVRAPAKMSANVGEMVITSDGRLVIGQAAGAGTVTARGRDVTVEKSVTSKSVLSITALRDLMLEADATIVTEAAVNLTAARDMAMGQGTTIYSETVSILSAPGRFTAGTGARVLSLGDVTLTSGSASFGPGSLTYAGVTPEGGTARVANLTFNIAGTASADSATFFATGRAVFDADEITIDASAGLDPSRLLALGTASLTADTLTIGRATIEANDALTIEGTERIATAAGTRIATARALRLTAAEMALAGGLISAGDGLTIQATNLTTGAATTVSAGGAVQANAASATLQGNVQGNGVTLAFTGDATLSGTVQSTAALSVTGQNLTLSGTNLANGNLTVTSVQAMTLSGRAMAGGDLIANAGAALQTSADLSANGRLQLSGSSLTQSGNLVGITSLSLASSGALTTASSLKSGGNLDLTAGAALTNNAGLLSGGTIRLAATDALINTGSGLAVTGADAAALSFTGATVQNSGAFDIAGIASLTALTGDLTNSGALTSGGNLQLQAGGAVTNSAALVSLAALSLTAGTNLINTQDLQAGGGLTLTSGQALTNSAKLIASGDISLAASTDLNNSGGFLSNGSFNLTAGGVLTQSGSGMSATGASANGLTMTGASIVQSGSARIAGNVAITATDGDLTNSGGLTSSGAMSLSATGTLDNKAALTSGGNLALSGQDITSTATLTALGTLSVVAGGDLTVEADTASLGNQTLKAANLLTLAANHRSVGGTINLSATTAEVPGNLIAQNLTSDVTEILTIRGNLVALSTATLRAGSINLDADASIVSIGAMGLIATDGGVSLAGNLATNAALTITATAGVGQTSTSTVTALSGTTMTAGDQISLAGILQSNGTISLTTPSAVILESTSKLISTMGDILVSAGGLDVIEQTLGAELSGELSAAGHITVSGSRVNHSGDLVAGGLTRLTSTTGGIDLGGTLSSGGFRLTSAKWASVSGDLRGAVQADAVLGFTNFGDIDADLFILKAGSFTNSGTLTVDGDAVLTLTGDATIRDEFTTSGLLAITSGGLIYNSALVDAGTSLSLRGVDLDNRGTLEGQTVSANFASITNAGTIHSLDDATLIASAGFINSGTVKAKDDLTISADRFFNESQIEAETGVLSILGKTLLDNNSGTIAAGEGILLATDADLVIWSSDGSSAIGTFKSGGWLNIQGTDGGAAGAVTVRAGEELVAKADLVIHAASFNNAGTIASAEGNLVLRSAGNQTNTGMIYAGGEWLMLRSDAAVLNDGGTILAAENLVVCGNGTTNCLPNLSTDRAASLTNNNGGRIETFTGDMILAADDIANERAVTITTTTPVVNYTDTETRYKCYFQFFGCLRGDRDFTREQTTDFESDFTLSAEQASLISGRDLFFNAVDVSNSHGLISATGDISISAGTLSNEGTTRGTTSVLERMFMFSEWGIGWSNRDLLSAESPVTTHNVTGIAYGTIEAGGTITGTITGTVTNESVNANALILTATPGTAPTVEAAELSPLSLFASTFGAIVAPDSINLAAILANNPNGPASITGTTVGAPILTPAPIDLASLTFTDGPGQTNPGAVTNPGTTTVTPGSVTTGINLGALGNDQLFAINGPNSTSPLIESRHEFIDLSAFISSDYFLSSLNFDPEITQRRLGDALVETWLVRDQLTQLTGGRILNPGMSEREQMRAMYDNAIDASSSLGLRPGVTLSPAQIASLTDNIIWMEERVVSGQRVLVPQVYLAAATVGPGPATGARISGTTIAMNVNNLNNSGGTIAAQDDLVIRAAGDITNKFGVLSAGTANNPGGSLSLTALSGKFTNLSGIITAGSIAISALDANIATDKMKFGAGSNIAEVAGSTASILATGSLNLSIIQDLTVTGANLQAGQNLTVFAGGDINLDALKLTHAAKFQDGRSINEFDRQTAKITTLTALTGNLSVVSAQFSDSGAITGGGDITTNGAALNAGGDLSVQAAMGNVTLGAVTETDYAMHYSRSGGWLASHQSRAESFDKTHIETALTGGQVNVFAARALVSDGSQSTSTAGDVTLTGGATVLLATTDINASYNHSSSSYLGGLFDFKSTTQDLRTLANVTSAKSAEDIFVDSASILTLQGTELEAARNISVRAAEATTILGAVNTTFNSTVSHNNNGFLVTDTTRVSVIQTASFPTLTAGGATSFDPGTMATISLDAYQASFGTSPMAQIGIGEAGNLDTRLAVMEQTLFPKDKAEEDKTAATDENTEKPGTSSNPAYNFAGSTVAIGRPTAADGAEFAYLDTLFDQGKLTAEDMALVQHEFFKQDTQLGVLGKLLVQYLTGFAMANVGALSSLGSIQQMMASSVISGTLEGAITGNFDLGKILGNAAFAGVSGFVGQNLNLGQSLGLSTDNLLGLGEGTLSVASIVDKFGHSAINAGLTTAVYGGDFGTNFASSFRSGVVNMAMADMQQIIGSRYNDANGNPINGGEGSFGHVSEHTILGCFMGEALGSGCAGGAVSAMGSALYAGHLERRGGSKTADAVTNATAQLIAGISAALVTGGDVGTTMTSAGIGLSGFMNNRQFHREEIEWIRGIARKFAKELGISEEEALQRLTREAASWIDRLYASEGGDAVAAAFLKTNKPKGIIVGTVGDGSYADHNQEWFAATEDQFQNSLINLSTVVNQSTFYMPLGSYSASFYGDSAIFVSSRLSEGGSTDSLDTLSPGALIDVLETAKSQLLVVLEGENYTETQKYHAAQTFATNVFWGFVGRDYTGATPEQLDQIRQYQGLSQAIQLELLPFLLAEGGTRFSDSTPGVDEQFRKNWLAKLGNEGDTPKRTVTRVGDGPLPTGQQTLDPTEISFSQATVSRQTSDGMTHDELVSSMRRDGWQGDPVDVVNMPDGAPTSMDNRRLLAAREAGIPIEANVRNASDRLTPAQADRFEVGGQRPTNWGEAIQLRTQRQGGMQGVDPSWPERFPNGSIYDPNTVGGQ